MAKVMVPIIKLKYDRQDAFPLAACEVLDLIMGDQRPEEPFTYTFRVGCPYDFSSEREAFDAWREQAVHDLRMQVEDKAAVERLIALLDDHEWDVSFLVDGY